MIEDWLVRRGAIAAALLLCGGGPFAGVASAQVSEVAAFPVGDDWAQVSWTTRQDADSSVDYGATDAYGATASDASRYVRHRVTLFGLKPGTTYHFRVRSADAAGKAFAGEDRTFTTGVAAVGCEGNPTGEPLGGGAGYSRIVDRANATVVVGTADALLEALKSAKPGDIIYVDDKARIDLSGLIDIPIPGGITLASGRGRNGSAGALVYTAEFAKASSRPLFRTNGTGIRITGLRLAGPNNSTGRTGPMYHGIYVASYWTEIDNVEMWGFNYAAIETTAGTKGLYVHHSYFHHNTRTGVGYGVCPSQGVALIEGNLFDFHRHSIASSGQSPSGYEARYNLVMEHSVSHVFDMHGAADFEKAICVGIWRFDEGAGVKTSDTSEYGRNDPAMFGFDGKTCWVEGKLNAALRFDGAGTYVDCTAHTNLAGKAFTVMGWIKPDALEGVQAVFSKGSSAKTGEGYSLRLVGPVPEVAVYDATGERMSTAAGQIPAGAWTHVAVSFDGSTTCLYINGSPVASFACKGVKQSAGLDFLIGRDSSAATSFFKGAIDEVRAYSVALPAADILRNYNGNGDIAGDIARVHHNTSRVADRSQVVVRGRPSVGFWVNDNWFYGTGSETIRQLNATGNLFVADNRFGPATVAPGGRAPALTWTGEPGCADGGVAQNEGGSGLCTFRVKYTDADNDPPLPGYPKLHLSRNGEELTYFTPLAMMPADTSACASGRVYFCQLRLPRGADYTYFFEAYDTAGNRATGAAVAARPGPVITAGNEPPFLYPVLNHPNYVENPVYPASGTVDTRFDFRAVYQDIDDDPPQDGSPKVRIVDAGGAEIAGSPFPMAELTRRAFANGREFQLLTKLPVGVYRCQIVARDARGAAAVSIPERSYPVAVKPAGSADGGSTPMTPFDPVR